MMTQLLPLYGVASRCRIALFTQFSAIVFMLTLVLPAGFVHAEDGVTGRWQTGVGKSGFLHVFIEPCDEKMCGTIVMAFDLDGVANPDFEHIGKRMIWNMTSTSGSQWGGGKIWDPEGGKTYNSKMSVEADVLSVSGCFLLFCRAQDWTRVQ